jgi:hypothetical protein
VVARELARVSAQLRNGDGGEEGEVIEETKAEKHSAGEPPAPSSEKETVQEAEMPGREPADQEEAPEIEFGRTRRHFGQAARKDNGTAQDEETTDKDKADDAEVSFSNEQASFGRVKRKRTR